MVRVNGIARDVYVILVILLVLHTERIFKLGSHKFNYVFMVYVSVHPGLCFVGEITHKPHYAQFYNKDPLYVSHVADSLYNITNPNFQSIQENHRLADPA